MIRRPPRSTPLYSSAASDVYKRQPDAGVVFGGLGVVDVLPGQSGPVRRRAGGDLDGAVDGQAADDRGVRVQEECGSAVLVSGQLDPVGGQLLADDVRVADRAL